MSKRLTMLVEDEVYDELELRSKLLSVPMSEFGRRGLDMVLGRNGFPPPPHWHHPGDELIPRRAGVKFERDRRPPGSTNR